MNSDRHVALLRGINVGGNNIIKMADLRGCFEAMGFTGVETYIQSGNVVFSSRPAKKAMLTRTIEKTLSKAFGYGSLVVLVSAEELERVVAQVPGGFGKQPDRYRYDVLFVKEPLTTREALGQITTNSAVDAVHAGEHALYFRRLISKATQSHLPKLVQRPVYKSLTIRNWNTTTRLLTMLSL
ncbi:MAG: DUF1697 domain-containing protein [Acidobacteria bacterium]|nr:MAG: DUF1697 domain-containing protein [Acidobacteriota bacterium]